MIQDASGLILERISKIVDFFLSKRFPDPGLTRLGQEVHIMNFDKPITRRESIRRLLQWSGTVTLAGAARLSLFELPLARAAAANKKFIVEGIGQKDGYSVNYMTKKVYEASV